MKFQLEDHWKGFVERVVGEGRFGSPDEVVREGLRLVEEREGRRQALRTLIEASIDEGGEITEEDLDACLAAKADELRRQGYAG